MQIRPYEERDWPQVWQIVKPIIRQPAPSGCRPGAGEYLLDWARGARFAGVQFNAVAASNTPAVRLYQSLGFTIIGTVPGAFEHPTLGRVGLHVMYHDLGL